MNIRNTRVGKAAGGFVLQGFGWNYRASAIDDAIIVPVATQDVGGRFQDLGHVLTAPRFAGVSA